MTKQELVKAISSKTSMTVKVADVFVNAFTETVTEELSNGGSTQIMGFGSFIIVDRAERQGHNLKTGEPLTIPAHKAIKFVASKRLKDAVNGAE
jgi:DNA-binding protein HU-beta